MKLSPRNPERSGLAFTRTELCFALIGLFVVGILILPLFARCSCKAVRINCVNNLKQVALAFRIWSGDNGDLYPMAILTNQHGGPLYANTDSMIRYFQVMSNELSTPKVLICPAEIERYPATNFGTGFANQHASYFIGLEADENRPNMFLSGDRTLDNGNLMNNGTMLLSSNQNLFWQPKKIHRGNGDVAMTDGSVSQLDNSRLKNAVARTGIGVTYLVFP